MMSREFSDVRMVPDSVRNSFDNICPVDARYGRKIGPLLPYFGENANIQYQLQVETALIEGLIEVGACPETVLSEVIIACGRIRTEEVYAYEYGFEGEVPEGLLQFSLDQTRAEELVERIKAEISEDARAHVLEVLEACQQVAGTTRKLKIEGNSHDIRALVKRIQDEVSDAAKPYIHLGATSYDIIDTANAARTKRAMRKVILPALIQLVRVLVRLAEEEAETGQIGRSHLQWGVPITFGHSVAWYLHRLGEEVLRLTSEADGLVGKLSGAMGAFNATSLVVVDPRDLERRVMAKMGLKPAEVSTQIVPPEPLSRLLDAAIRTSMVMGNIGRDMRRLQASEVGEVGEYFDKEQVGSSTMPNKQNPINFEQAEGWAKTLLSASIPSHLEMISEHQRDLTGSVPNRFNPMYFTELYLQVTGLTRTMKGLVVHRDNMDRHLDEATRTMGEAYNILLSKYGHTLGHERIRQLSVQATIDGEPIWQKVARDPELAPYLEAMTAEERRVLTKPKQFYRGLASENARGITAIYKTEMDELERSLQS